MSLKEAMPENVARTLMFWSSPDDSWHTPETIMAVTGLANNTLLNWRAQGKGPEFIRSGKLIYYRKQDVTKWLKTFQPSNAPAE